MRTNKTAETEEAMTTRIVIVDDHGMVREGLRGLLGDMDGVEVAGEASSVGQALAVIGDTDPDLVLLDLCLGSEDGNEVSRRLRAEGSTAKILVLSAQEASKSLREALAAGADGYLLKGVSLKALAASIEQAMSGGTVISPEFLPKLREDAALGVPAGTAVSPREREVLELLGQGLSDPAIGERLGISSRTVQGHTRSLVDKLQAEGRSDLVGRTFREGALG